MFSKAAPIFPGEQAFLPAYSAGEREERREKSGSVEINNWDKEGVK